MNEFPIMRDYGERGRRHIPWAMIEPHEGQARLNHDQSLALLASRGGLSACEAVAILENRSWVRMTDADKHLTRLLQEWEAKHPPPEQETATNPP